MDDPLSEALIFASTNPQFDNRFFIELQVQYLKILSANLVRTCCVNKLFLTFRTIFVHNMFSPCSAKRKLLKKIYLYNEFESATTVCTKSVPEIYEHKETVFNLRRQLSLSPATGPGRKARQLNSSVKDFSREFHHFAGIDNFEEYWKEFDLNIVAVIFHKGSFYIVGIQMQYIGIFFYDSEIVLAVFDFCCIFGCKYLSNRKNRRHDIYFYAKKKSLICT